MNLFMMEFLKPTQASHVSFHVESFNADSGPS